MKKKIFNIDYESKKMRVILILFCIPHFQIQNRRLPTRVVLGQRDTLSLRPEKQIKIKRLRRRRRNAWCSIEMKRDGK